MKQDMPREMDPVPFAHPRERNSAIRAIAGCAAVLDLNLAPDRRFFAQPTIVTQGYDSSSCGMTAARKKEPFDISQATRTGISRTAANALE